MRCFRDGLVFKAHRLVYHSILGLRVIQKIEDYVTIGMANGQCCMEE